MSGTAIWTGPNAAQVDGNQNPTMMMVAGTLGTADTKGTSAPIRMAGDPATGAQYVYNLGPAGSVSLGNITGGTINQIGTILGLGGTVQIAGSVSTGSGTQPVQMLSGTLNTGTVTVGTIPGIGTVTNIGSISTIGTMPSINANPASGTLNTLGTIGTVLGIGGTVQVSGASAGTNVNIVTGTINSATTVLSSGTISVLPNLPQGSINVTAGTINTGTVTILNAVGTAGSAMPAAAVAIGGTDGFSDAIHPYGIEQGQGDANNGNSFFPTALWAFDGSSFNRVKGTAGTIAVAQATAGTIATGSIAVTSGTGIITSGSISVIAGTIGTISSIGTLPNLTQGSIQVTAGTMSAGTINTGTIQLNPLVATNTVLHAGTSGTTAIGTLIAAQGSGTASYITHYSILVISGTPEVCLSFGSVTNGNQVIAHGLFPAGGGMVESIPYPHGYGTSNSAVTYQIVSGAGTVAWDINYFNHT